LINPLYLLTIAAFITSVATTIAYWLTMSTHKPVLSFPTPNSSQTLLLENPSNPFVAVLSYIYPYSLITLVISSVILGMFLYRKIKYS
jgi:hypothetical protein